MILFFSATGNSRFVAQQLAERTGDTTFDLYRCVGRCNAVPAPFTLAPSEPIGFVFPVHSWGLPRGLSALFRSLEFAVSDKLENHYCYMVCTCGDDAGLTAKQWQSAVAKSGLIGSAAYSVFMPDTYVILPGFDVDSPEQMQRKLAEAPEAIDTIAQRVANREAGDFTHHGSFAWLKSKVVYPLFVMSLSDRPFRVDRATCIRCGKCAKVCPVGDISMSRDKLPQWNGWCQNCLACRHYCPTHSISFIHRHNRKGYYYFSEKQQPKEATP